MMALLRRVFSFVRNLVYRDRIERDLDDEVRAAFDLLVDEKIHGGMRAADACRAATLELGRPEAIREQIRDARAGAAVEILLQDVRYAARTLRRSPLFTLIAVLSLGIGIAGTTVVFSIADGFLFHTWPGIANPARLVEIGRTDSGVGENADRDPYATGPGFDTFSYPNYVDYRERQTVFEGLAAYRHNPTFGLATGDAAVRVSGGQVSANYFAVLGVPIVLGRGFLPEDEQTSIPRAVTVISDRLWRTQFAGDPAVIGRTIRLNGRPFEIVGVAARGFSGYTIAAESLWTPLTAYPDGDDLRRLVRRGQQWLMGIGRLKDGVNLAQARAEMARIARDLEREYPDDNRRHGVGVEASGAVPVDGRPIIHKFIALLFALVGLILVIACTNVAGMLLGRGLSRGREIAVRLALGAKRQRVFRLLILESVLLAILAAGVGLAGTWIAIHLVKQLIPLFRIDVAFNIGVDWQVMAFSIVIATVTGVACGLVPARAAVRMDLASAMKPDISGTPRRMRARHAFVIAQVAMSVLLVVCALLLGRSLRNAGTIDPGFVTDDVQVMGLDLLLGGYDTSRGSVFAQTLMSRLKTLPGIEAAASARVVPLTMETEGGRVWLPQDYGDERAIAASWNFVTPGYFSTIRLPLVSGRNFDENDRAAAPAVAIVNETFASRAWPGQNPVGRHLVVGASRRPLQVIGVARDAKYRTIGEEPTSFIYVPAAQRYESIMWILIRSRGPSVIPQVRALVRELNPSLPILTAATLADMTAFGLFPQRVAAWLAGVVGIIGMLLTALGVYGLSAYNVSQRAREIGIRVALGAIRVRVVRLVVGQAMLPTVIGTMFGLIAAAVVTRLLAGMLYDIRPLDPISFAGGAIALVALTLVASFIPARRAASVNPVEVLRAE